VPLRQAGASVLNLPELSRARQVKVFFGQREIIAIATRVAETLFHPRIVLAARYPLFVNRVLDVGASVLARALL
jgi:hypothetical protein